MKEDLGFGRLGMCSLHKRRTTGHALIPKTVRPSAEHVTTEQSLLDPF